MVCIDLANDVVPKLLYKSMITVVFLNPLEHT